MTKESRQVLLERVEQLEAENRRLRGDLTFAGQGGDSLFEHLAEHANAIIFVYLDGRFTYVNMSMEEVMGVSREELLTRPCTALIGRDTCTLLEEIALRGPGARDYGRTYDLDIPSADGDLRYFTCSISFLPSREGHRLLVHGIDTTRRRAAEESLKESEERYRSLTESAPDIIYTLDLQGCFTYVNPKWEAILGHRPAEVIGKAFRDFAIPRDRDQLHRLFGRVRDRKEAVELAHGCLLDKDGNTRWFELSSAPYLNEKGEVIGMVGIAKDNTEKGKIEDRLRKAQKMEAVGTLAGGVAHDFNNILQSIQSYTQLLLMGQKPGDQAYSRLRQIEKSTQRASELTKQLLAFSQKAETRFRPVNINDIINKFKGLLEKTLPKMVRVKLLLNDNIAQVLADPGHVEQAIMNLAVNARDAMPEGGTFTIETDMAVLDEEFCRTRPGSRPGTYTMLSFSDTGQGMEPEVLDHIFEPFYTTREVGSGTGLGLATVYGIVKSHDGYITCQSEPNSGTTFQIYLPALHVSGIEPEEGGRTEDRGGYQPSLIMLVDDEETLREVGREILEAFGYTVITASSGEEALELLADSTEGVDLIILDLIMPGMGGQRCLKNIIEANPQQKIVVASGYAATGQAQEVIKDGALGFISKPYDLEKMIKLIRSVMAKD